MEFQIMRTAVNGNTVKIWGKGQDGRAYIFTVPASLALANGYYEGETITFGGGRSESSHRTAEEQS